MSEKVEIGEVLGLDRDYAVVASIYKENFQYVFLVACEKPMKVMFGKIVQKEDDLVLEVVHTKTEKQELLELFRDSMSNMLESGKFAEILRSM